jgi:murein DD-endopeptidase MepM/ murein hydrolase activator NlpD
VVRVGARGAVVAVSAVLAAPVWLAGVVLGLSAGGGNAAPTTGCAAVAPRALDAWMRAREPRSPLVGLGDVFVAAGSDEGVDPRLLVAIAAQESALGTAGDAFSAHNPFGIGPGREFASWPASIEAAARLLHSEYLGRGLTTVAAIGARWAPPGAANDPTGLNGSWQRGVSALLVQLGGDPGRVGSSPCGSAGPGRVLLPMAVSAVVIGLPNAPGSTHDPNAWPDNWQSDNAVDLAMPAGTPLTAVCDGVVGPRTGSLGPSSSRFGGVRFTLRCRDGRDWYYAHLTALAPAIRPGAVVRAGQGVGWSGVANGVPHLHLAVSGGDPLGALGIGDSR